MELTLTEQQIEAVAARVAAAFTKAGRQDAARRSAPAPATEEPWSEGPDREEGDGALAPMIDHTLLKPMATPDQVVALCAEASAHGFASVCVNPSHVALASKELKGSVVMVCTVIGFPLGATTSTAKAAESAEAVANGAEELDMVLAVGHLKAGEYEYVFEDIAAVVGAAGGRTVKVILETAMLTDEEKVAACLLCKGAGADFVKTSTGFGGGGATPEDIALMRRIVGPDMGVKASGGVRDAAGAWAVIEAGASRIGASASVAIVGGGTGAAGY